MAARAVDGTRGRRSPRATFRFGSFPAGDTGSGRSRSRSAQTGGAPRERRIPETRAGGRASRQVSRQGRRS